MTSRKRGTPDEHIGRLFRFAASNVIVLAGNGVVAAISFATYALFGRHFSVNEFGDISALLALVLIFSILSTAVGSGVALRAAQLIRAPGPLRVRHAATVAALALLAAVAVGGLLYLSAPLIAGFLTVGLDVARAAALASGAACAVPALRGVFQGAQRFSVFAVSSVLEVAGRLAGALLLITPLGVSGALLGFAAGSAASYLLTLAAVPLLNTRGDTSAAIRPFAIPVMLIAGTTMITGLASLDSLLVKHLVSSADAGLFGALALTGRAQYFAMSVLPTTLLPAVASAHAAGKRSRTLLNFSIALIAFSGTVAVLLYAFAPTIVLNILVGAKFLRAGTFLVPYGVAVTALATAGIFSSYGFGRENFRSVIPLALVLGAETCALFLVHSLGAIVSVIMIGHTLAAFGTWLSLPRDRAIP